MKNSHVKVFWIGFLFTAGLSAWIYWIWRQKREVAPEPIVVSSYVPRPAETRKGGARERRPPISEPLEEIKGIGPVFANRLNEAGIYSFAQLAAASPDEIQQITGVNRWDPADWIAEAKKLANAE